MSDPLGRHFCPEAQDLDDFGNAYCPFLKQRVQCCGVVEECVREREAVVK